MVGGGSDVAFYIIGKVFDRAVFFLYLGIDSPAHDVPVAVEDVLFRVTEGDVQGDMLAVFHVINCVDE